MGFLVKVSQRYVYQVSGKIRVFFFFFFVIVVVVVVFVLCLFLI